MGDPPHLVLPDPSRRQPSLSSLGFSPDSCATSSSLASSDFSFCHSLPSSGDFAPNILIQQEKQQQQQNAVLNGTMVRQKKRAKLKQATESSCAEPIRECNTGAKGLSMRKVCCRNAGAFAADCAAVSCCPCAVLSLLSFVLIDIPSALARKIAITLGTRLHLKDAMSMRSIRGRQNSLSIFTPTWSCREASEGEGEKQAVTIFRLSTQNLLEHFDAEHVGFGCLSLERK